MDIFLLYEKSYMEFYYVVYRIFDVVQEIDY